jgi:hypothetical protein
MHPCSDLVICALVYRWRPCGAVMYRDLRMLLASYITDPWSRICCWVALFHGAADHGSKFPLTTTWHRIMANSRVNARHVKMCHLPALVRTGNISMLDKLRPFIIGSCNELTLVYEIVRARAWALASKYSYICVDTDGWERDDIDVIKPMWKRTRFPNVLHNPPYLKKLSSSDSWAQSITHADSIIACSWFRGNASNRGRMLMRELMNRTELHHLMTQSNEDASVHVSWLVAVPVDKLDSVMVGLYTARVKFVHN